MLNTSRKIFYSSILLLSVVALGAFPGFVDAQTSSSDLPEQAVAEQEYYIGEVVEVVSTETDQSADFEQLTQNIKVELLSGTDKGLVVEIVHGGTLAKTQDQALQEGDKIIVVAGSVSDEKTYFVADQYRIPELSIILGVFLFAVLIFGRKKGLGSILGLFISILVLVFFIVPQIVKGLDPLVASISGALVVAGVSIYLAHGFNKKTTIALLSTVLTLVISGFLAVAFVKFSKLFGLGSEEAFFVQTAAGNPINLQGLLLGGIIIGALGVLDDITTSQAATVQEISRANPDLEVKELYKRGVKVGREHISSLVNTLVFAYAGASFPLLVLFTIGQNEPFWVTLNSEQIAEEVVRTLVGSTALILAVPITTFLAAKYLKVQDGKGLTKLKD